MEKRFIILPLIVFAGLLVLGLTGFLFFFAEQGMETDYYLAEMEDEIKMLEEEKAYTLSEIDGLKEDAASEDEMAISQSNLDYLNERIRDLEEYAESYAREQEEYRIRREKERRIQLIAGIGIVIIGALCGAVIVGLINWLILTKRTRFRRWIMLVLFIISLIIMLLCLGEKEDTAALCFAVIAGSALLGHVLGVSLPSSDKDGRYSDSEK